MGTVNGAVPRGWSSWGVDLSAFNVLTTEHWDWLRDNGCGFVMLRATRGVRDDAMFVSHVRSASTRGMQVGAYHLLVPESVEPITAQMEAFRRRVAQVEMLTGHRATRIAVDIEGAEMWHAADKPASGLRRALWLARKSLTGLTPMIYTYPTFWRTWLNKSPILHLYPLWGAWYVSTPRPSTNFTFAMVEAKFGRKGVALWQYGGNSDPSVGPVCSKNVVE